MTARKLIAVQSVPLGNGKVMSNPFKSPKSLAKPANKAYAVKASKPLSASDYAGLVASEKTIFPEAHSSEELCTCVRFYDFSPHHFTCPRFSIREK